MYVQMFCTFNVHCLLSLHQPFRADPAEETAQASLLNAF